MRNRVTAAVLVATVVGLIPAAGLAQTYYSQDFETMLDIDPAALADDDWLVFGIAYDSAMNFLYQYGPFQAPNHDIGFSRVVTGEGGIDQGLQQLSVFSDYNNGDHKTGWIESIVYREWVIDASQIGKTWRFQFDAKRGSWADTTLTTAEGFIKTIDPGNNYAMTNFVMADMTNAPETWGTYICDLIIIPELVGQLIQVGFSSKATEFQDSGVYYDNIFFMTDVSAVPDATTMAGATMKQNYPNPFNPMTRIDFALDKSQLVEVSVFDLAGRRVATLHRGELGAGDHHVVWDGKTDAGREAAAGQYRYVLKTASGQVARSMTLLK